MSTVNEMSNVSLHWHRPPGPLNVWRIKESTKLFKDGRPLKYYIQEIPEDRYTDVLDHMCSDFVRDEPTCKANDVEKDELCLKDFRKFWLVILKQGICIGAFIDHEDGSKPVLAGVNMVFVVTKEDEELLAHTPQLCESPKARRTFYTMMGLGAERDVKAIYNVDKYMSAFGLSVASFYRGEKLGLDLLLTRNDVGRKYGIEATSTVFTAASSQCLAERAGFQVAVAKLFDNVLDEDGNILYPKLMGQWVKVMHMKLK